MAKYGTFLYGSGQMYGTTAADSNGTMWPVILALPTMKPALLAVPTMKPTGA